MSVALLHHGRVAESLFDVLGHLETDATAAVGFVCARVPRFAASVVELATGTPSDAEEVRLEQRTSEHKRTDAEHARVVIEAKVGFDIPTAEQLEQYRERLVRERDRRPGYLVTLTNAAELAHARLGDRLDEAPIVHLSWEELHEAARAVAANTRGTERFLLDELTSYLKGIMAARDLLSNRVYVVSLGKSKVAETDMDFIDVILEYGRYFHPAHGAKGFPATPPNYLGFRFDGKLQQIRHVQDARIYDMRSDRPDGLPDLRHDTWWTFDASTGRADHVLYTLGPPIIPSQEVRTGNLYRAARVWAHIDLLLTSPTIAEAAALTHERENGI